MEIHQLGAHQITEKINKGELSCLQVTEHFLQRIDTLNPKINAVVQVNEQAIEQAKKIDKGPKGNLAGLPLGIKDLFCTKNITTTACSKILANFNPPYTATCVDRLEKQGAIVIAKLNMDEFAMGSSNEVSHFGPCLNPWDLKRVPGGSSGGSAAAVAGGLVPVSLGSDTGGSIRQPAHFCGIVGIKPTYGSISRYGMIAFASSLDQAGPMAHSVEDCALLLDAMVGPDTNDSTCLPRKVGSLRNLQPKSLKGLRVGLPKEYFTFEIDEDVDKSFSKAKSELENQGVEFIEVSLPHTEYAVPVYYLIATSEASSNLSRYDGVRFGLRVTTDEEGKPLSDLADFYSYTRSEGFGEEVQRRILLGTFALSAGYCDDFYYKACRVRRLISQDFSAAFQDCDFIISPVATSSAFKVGERISDPVQMYNNDVFTTSVSLAGLPSMSLPVEVGSAGLPVGMQIIAPAFQEEAMIGFAKAVEKTFSFSGVPDVW